MRKMLGYSALGFAAWFALAVSWSALSLLTPLPGPARVASASIDAAAGAVESVRAPGPLAVPQRLLTRQMRRSGRLVTRIYRAPERLARRLLDRGLHRSHLAFAVRAAPAPRPPVAPEPPSAVVAPSVDAEIEARIRAELEASRAEVEASGVEVRIRMREVRERLEEARRRIEEARAKAREKVHSSRATHEGHTWSGTGLADARIRIESRDLEGLLKELEGLGNLDLDLQGLGVLSTLENLELPAIRVRTRVVN